MGKNPQSPGTYEKAQHCKWVNNILVQKIQINISTSSKTRYALYKHTTTFIQYNLCIK